MRFGLKALEYLKETDEKKYKELLEKDPVKDPNNFLERVQHMNQLKSIAEELTLNDIIYKE